MNLPPGRKVDRLTPRVLPPSDVEQRLRACVPRVPITRLTDLTPLDHVGIPVFSAITPLAKDLTTHLGKGLDAASARVSALMEAVERVSAEECPGELRHASLEALLAAGVPAVDPRDFDLPDDSTFSPAVPIRWTRGWELLDGREVWLPVDLVISPPAEGVLSQVDSNGLASGSTSLEAIVHALCELIERDAAGQQLFRAMFSEPEEPAPPPRGVDLGTLPDSVGPLLERLERADLSLVVADLTTELGVACFKATLVDTAHPGPEGPAPHLFLGYGAAPHAEVAVRRAITEAVQARAGLIQAARDSHNLIPGGSHAGAWRAGLRELEPSARHPFASVPTFESDELLDDLRHLLGRLRQAGCPRVIAVELTRPELGIPVVRVRVPGLTPFLGNRRRVGWRCLRHLL
jgi:ribosomal protein S12 methylthiotransferase accessory factor